MNSINIELERTKKILFIERLHNEIEFLEEKYDIEPDSKTSGIPRYDFLMNIYKELMDDKKTSLDGMFDAMNDGMYKKKWNRLPTFHKLRKIKEYLDSRDYDEIKKKEIYNEIKKKIEAGEMNTCKSVIYDTVECKIMKIIVSKGTIY